MTIEDRNLLTELEETAFNDPEAIRLWQEYLLNYVPESRRERFSELWTQSGSPYRKEYEDLYHRASFTEGKVGAPDTLHVGEYGGVHDTMAEMSHAYQFTHPELENIDLNEDIYLDIMKNPPSLDYAYRARKGRQSDTEWGATPKWLKHLPSSISEPLKAFLDYSGHITEDMGRYHKKGTVEHEAHGPIENTMYTHYDGRVEISEEAWKKKKLMKALGNLTPLIPVPSKKRK